jgi:NADPH:quinone reductase-like Zn-dependent oxidoreductase
LSDTELSYEFQRSRFPYQIGYDAAGIVTDIGEGVTRLKIGDKVYTRLPEVGRGTKLRPDDKLQDQGIKLTVVLGAWSEYVKCSENYVALKPTNLSFSDTASLPLAGVTSLQVLRKYHSSLEGKTVFIPAGCQ